MPVRDRFPGTPVFRQLRPKSIRAKTVALLAIPVVTLMALWALATVSAVQSAWTQHQIKELDTQLAGPLGELVDNLQTERAAVLGYLAAPRAGVQDTVTAQQTRTDAAATALLNGETVAKADIQTLTPDVAQRITTVVDDLARLHNQRTPSTIEWNDAYTSYTSAIEDAFAIDESLTKVQQGQTSATQRVVVNELAHIREMIARQDAVTTSAQATGRITPEQYRAFADAYGGQHEITDNASPDLSISDRSAYQHLLTDDAERSLTALQRAILDAGTSRPMATVVSADAWHSAVQLVSQRLSDLQATARATATAQADSSSATNLARAGLTAVLGLLAVLLTLFVSVRIGRGLVSELVQLRNSALELAHRRLPHAMSRIRAGEKIDLATDADVPVVVPGDGEIGEVGEALNAVQHAALRAAAERAELLTGVAGVFVNLARRSQSLVHRQLSLLDALERRTDDPATLEDLFRLDHLATRMRRHAEGLIIMSGSAPGRTWSKPVPLMTVIRSAISEVEDYARVDVHRMPELSVLGSVVADLTHLVAELVENATTFSPPSTSVLVHGEPVGSGFVIEIDDRGLGMHADKMAELNGMISSAHQFDLFDSDRLGLFVVSRLANRQNIDVSLRRSPYGGTTAVILLPTAILAPSEPIEQSQAPQQRAIVGRVPAADSTSVQATPALSRHAADDAPEPEPAALAITRHAATDEPPAPSPAPVPINRHAADEDSRAPVGDEQLPPTPGGLPRRKRQASLAPGLRDVGTRNNHRPRDLHPSGTTPISPDQALEMMSAFQQGLVRGRSAESDDFPNT
jgi:signal transduction histidine kinase